MDLFRRLIDERLQERKLRNDTKGDVLDVLHNISKDSPEELDGIHIERLLFDLFVAGTETISIKCISMGNGRIT